MTSKCTATPSLGHTLNIPWYLSLIVKLWNEDMALTNEHSLVNPPFRLLARPEFTNWFPADFIGLKFLLEPTHQNGVQTFQIIC